MRLVILFLLMSFGTLNACTGIKLVAKDGSIVHGRTEEFGLKIPTTIIVVPRGYGFTGTTPRGPGLFYKAKYAFVGAVGFDPLAILDGMNERGLAVGTFYFPTFASYAEVTPDNQARALSPVEFPNWILTQFASLDELKASLSTVVIVPTISEGWGSEPPPFHYVVYDKKGNSLVIEPIQGKLLTYDNSLGVITNAPSFDWHMINLRNYINLKIQEVQPVHVGGLVFAPLGQGAGLLGLPGDFTPPSRFVRATIYSTTAIPSENAEQAVFQAFHILNQFDIPLGVDRREDHGIIHSDYTMATCVKDPQSLRYYYKTYDDQTIRYIDLNQCNLKAKTIKTVDTAGFQKAVDMTSVLK